MGFNRLNGTGLYMCVCVYIWKFILTNRSESRMRLHPRFGDSSGWGPTRISAGGDPERHRRLVRTEKQIAGWQQYIREYALIESRKTCLKVPGRERRAVEAEVAAIPSLLCEWTPIVHSAFNSSSDGEDAPLLLALSTPYHLFSEPKRLSSISRRRRNLVIAT